MHMITDAAEQRTCFACITSCNEGFELPASVKLPMLRLSISDRNVAMRAQHIAGSTKRQGDVRQLSQATFESVIHAANEHFLTIAACGVSDCQSAYQWVGGALRPNHASPFTPTRTALLTECSPRSTQHMLLNSLLAVTQAKNG